jgi:hypothetical protein
MSLNNYQTAMGLLKAMEDGPQYAKVIAGPRAGTIGRVMQVSSKYYSAHEYRLSVKGKRPFWVKGSFLEHLVNWAGGTFFAEDKATPFYNDLMGRRIEIGHTILFPRGTEGARVDMVMGTVKQISEKGTIYAKLFKSGQGNEDVLSALVRVGKPSSAMIIDNGTVNQVMLAKLMS